MSTRGLTADAEHLPFAPSLPQQVLVGQHVRRCLGRPAASTRWATPPRLRPLGALCRALLLLLLLLGLGLLLLGLGAAAMLAVGLFVLLRPLVVRGGPGLQLGSSRLQGLLRGTFRLGSSCRPTWCAAHLPLLCVPGRSSLQRKTSRTTIDIKDLAWLDALAIQGETTVQQL
jgi:hypothetical protein